MPELARQRAGHAAVIAIVAVAVMLSCASALRTPRFEPDDYRYLRIVEDVKQQGWDAVLRAGVVENRWDDLWWISAEPVQFFRPVVVVTYAVEAGLLGFGPRGMVLVNVLIHLACTALVAVLAVRWLGRTAAAALAVMLFGVMRCHLETLWYVAGRTDSLAALFFLAALVAHGGARWRALAVPAFALALLTKEMTAAFPIVAVLHDRWVSGLRRTRLYVAYAVTFLAYLGVRHWVLGAPRLPYPYFVAPDRPEFAGHLATQAVSYAASIFWGVAVVPFRRWADVQPPGTAVGVVLGVAAASVAVWLLRRHRVAWLLATTAATTWALTSVAYVSERYLYLPSVAVAMGAGLVVLEAKRRGGTRWYAAALGLLGAWSVHQSVASWSATEALAQRKVPMLLGHIAPVRDALTASGRPVLVFNFPGDWVDAQFLQDVLRVELGRADLHVRVVTTTPRHPDMGRSVVAYANDGNVALVGLGKPVMSDPHDPFPGVRLESGTRVDRPAVGFRVEVEWGNGEAAWRLRVQLPRPFTEYSAIVFTPDADTTLTPWERIVRGRYLPLRAG